MLGLHHGVDGVGATRDGIRDVGARVGMSTHEPMAVQLEGDVIGYCGLIVGHATVEEPEIAYELFRRVHGRGYATEAAGAVPRCRESDRATRALIHRRFVVRTLVACPREARVRARSCVDRGQR
jgi:hypothetical protein